MDQLMHGFPPAPDHQVTLTNWRSPPYNRWSFQHVRELVPTAEIANFPDDVWDLPVSPTDLSGLLPDPDNAPQLSFSQFLTETGTDGLVILHRGRIVFEHYAHGMTSDTPHILMSVSKSLLALLAGILTGQGHLAPGRLVTDFVPELGGTAYCGATVRDLLDMRAGVQFDEDYLATSGPIIEYRRATNWNPPSPGDTPSDLRSWFCRLTETQGVHGGMFHYISPNTDLLGWVIERATGQRFADLLSDLLWKPMGAMRSACITVDRLGAPRCAGGISASVRDLARVGQLIVQAGRRGDRQIVPGDWISDIMRNGDRAAWEAGRFAACFPGLPIAYRSQWYSVQEETPLLFGFGIHGQHLFVDPQCELVISKVSSQALPLDLPLIDLTMRAVSRIRRFFRESSH